MFIRDTSSVPDHGWTYTVEQTGFTISTRNYDLLFTLIRQHCTSNNVPAPTDQQILVSFFANLAIPCVEGNQPLINRFTQGLPSVTSIAHCCGGQQAPV